MPTFTDEASAVFVLNMSPPSDMGATTTAWAAKGNEKSSASTCLPGLSYPALLKNTTPFAETVTFDTVTPCIWTGAGSVHVAHPQYPVAKLWVMSVKEP